MASSRVEYRVRWKREGRRETTRIFQSWAAAYRKARGIVGLEAAKERTSYYALPALEEGPVIESRPVGDWGIVEETILVDEHLVDSMAEWAGDRSPTTTDIPF